MTGRAIDRAQAYILARDLLATVHSDGLQANGAMSLIVAGLVLRERYHHLTRQELAAIALRALQEEEDSRIFKGD